MPTFRNTLFHLHRQVGVEWLGLRNDGIFIREKVWLENSLSHPPSYWLRLFSSQIFSRMDTPTILKFSHSTPTCLWRWNRQSVPKRLHIKFRRWGTTQKKTYNIQNTVKVWNQESILFLLVRYLVLPFPECQQITCSSDCFNTPSALFHYLRYSLTFLDGHTTSKEAKQAFGGTGRDFRQIWYSLIYVT
jgi:hypothetical protein